MNVQLIIESKLQKFDIQYLEIINESFMHDVPEGSESHFKLIIVSKCFKGKRLIDRHQLIYECLSNDIFKKIHALTLHTLTPSEWLHRNFITTDSPKCIGSKPSDT